MLRTIDAGEPTRKDEAHAPHVRRMRAPHTPARQARAGPPGPRPQAVSSYKRLAGKVLKYFAEATTRLAGFESARALDWRIAMQASCKQIV